jgi:predicted transcriptional regulator
MCIHANLFKSFHLEVPMSSAVTVRLEKPETLEKLDALAKSTARSRNWLVNRALEDYVQTQAWQMAKIQEGIDAANRGDFATDEEVQRVLNKHRSK